LDFTGPLLYTLSSGFNLGSYGETLCATRREEERKWDRKVNCRNRGLLLPELWRPCEPVLDTPGEDASRAGDRLSDEGSSPTIRS